MRRVGVILIQLTLGLAVPALAQEAPPGVDLREWSITPKRVDEPLLRHRLLPAEHELTDGNAAPILLRIPWDRLPYMNVVVPTIPPLLQIPLADTERLKLAAAGIQFEGIYSEMRFAAFRRTADWGYPLREQPLSEIVLRDVQGSRDFQRALSVWIRGQIASGDLDAAREGILVGLANSRHLGRTPIVITQLVAGAQIGMMLDRLEELIQQANCPNLYWALATLPAPIVDFRPAFELNRVFLQRSMTGLTDLDRKRTTEEWQELADRVAKFLEPDAEEKANVGGDDRRATQRLAAAFARKDLPRRQPDLGNRISGMSEGEVLVRWSIARHTELSDRIAAAMSLDFPQAFQMLCNCDQAAADLAQRWGSSAFYSEGFAASTYASLRARDRRIAALRIVEAIRNHAAGNDGKVPEKLRQLQGTPAPADPFTGEPFEYEPMADGQGFRLAAPPLEFPEIGKQKMEPRHGFEWKVQTRLGGTP